MVLHLAEPASHAARVIAQEQLAGVRTAFGALDSGDKKALHDLRVALRRLRGWLRAYDAVLHDTLRRGTRRALSNLAQATNAPRDAEVALAWVRSQRDLPPECRAGRAALIKQLTDDCARWTLKATDQLASQLPAAMRDLEIQLSHYWLRVPVGEQPHQPGMGSVTAELVTRYARRLRKSLRRIRSIADVEATHRTRMAGKRLRYLLEPFAWDRPTVRIIERLQALQDGLGEFHDAQLLGGRIVQFKTDAGSRPALWPGLDELSGRIRARERVSFTKFRRAWNTRGASAVFERVGAIASSLRTETTLPVSFARSAP
jgi:CHAD domain-containing protein